MVYIANVIPTVRVATVMKPQTRAIPSSKIEHVTSIDVTAKERMYAMGNLAGAATNARVDIAKIKHALNSKI